MDKVKKTAPESGLPAEASLTHTLGKNERVKDLVEELSLIHISEPTRPY